MKRRTRFVSTILFRVFACPFLALWILAVFSPMSTGPASAGSCDGITDLAGPFTDLTTAAGESCLLYDLGGFCSVQGVCGSSNHLDENANAVGVEVGTGALIGATGFNVLGKYFGVVNGTRKVWVQVSQDSCTALAAGYSDGTIYVGDTSTSCVAGNTVNEPENLAAVAQDSTVLSWDDASDNEEGFIVERSLDGTAWSEVGTAAADAVEYTDLMCGDPHYYRVAAYKGDIVSDYSNTAVSGPGVETRL